MDGRISLPSKGARLRGAYRCRFLTMLLICLTKAALAWVTCFRLLRSRSLRKSGTGSLIQPGLNLSLLLICVTVSGLFDMKPPLRDLGHQTSLLYAPRLTSQGQQGRRLYRREPRR